MARKPAKKSVKRPRAATAPKLTAATRLPKGAKKVDLKAVREPEFRYTYRTGPFALPQDTHSLDWAVLNNDTTRQRVRVTVFRCPIGGPKTADPPGPLVVTISPGHTTHNANGAPGGMLYEIQVECNSRLIFPYATAWPGAISDPIPGSVVKAAEFIRHLS